MDAKAPPVPIGAPCGAPPFPDIAFAAGRATIPYLLALKQALDAFNDFNKAISIRPDNAQAYYNRGLLYQSQRQHQFAIDDFTTAIGLTQNDAGPFIARGLSYMAINDFKSAASDLDDAVSQDSQNIQAWTSRGLAYERLGDKEKAAKLAREGVAEGTGQVLPLANLADILWWSGAKQEALDTFKKLRPLCAQTSLDEVAQ